MVVLSHTLAKPSKVTGHVNLGSNRRDCAPWEATRRRLHFHIVCDVPKWWAHTFSARDCQSLDFTHSTTTSGIGSAEEGSRRLCRSHWHPPLLGDKPLAGIAKDWELCCLPVRISSTPRSCIWCGQCCYHPLRVYGCCHNVKLLLFQLAFCSPIFWVEFEI